MRLLAAGNRVRSSLIVTAVCAQSVLAPLRVAAQAAPAAPATPDAATAQHNEDEARAHFLLGRAHHDRGEFAKAAQEFELAYAASGRAALLYNLFVAYRDANDARRAADALERYLRDAKEVENRQQLEAKLAAMQAAIAQEDAANAAAPQPSETPATEPAPTQPAEGAQPAPDGATEATAESDSDDGDGLPLGPIIVIGVGGAMMLGSIGTGLVASGAQSELDEECPTRTNCDPSLQSTKDKGETFALVTDVLLFGGIATASAGLVWWLLGSGSDSSDSADSAEPTASIVCGPAQCGGRLHFKF